jgi:type III pantothenate kinase
VTVKNAGDGGDDPGEVLLVIDAGNTRVKWALACGGTLERDGHAVHRGRVLEHALMPLARLEARPARALVANVGGTGLEYVLGKIVRERFGVDIETVAVLPELAGLRIAYDVPARLGVDRWLAMLGARAARPGAALLVVGAGTALTIDAVAGDGTHLGGCIAPGIATMKDSLLSVTAGIRDAGDADRAPEIFAADTGPAVAGGVAHALAALVERAARELASRAGAAPQLMLTGGDAKILQPLIEVPAVVASDLVLQGLAVYARAR